MVSWPNSWVDYHRSKIQEADNWTVKQITNIQSITQTKKEVEAIIEKDQQIYSEETKKQMIQATLMTKMRWSVHMII